MADIEVEIKGLKELRQAFRDYPKISEPIMQRAIVGTSALLAKYTTKQTVPWRTGYLATQWGFSTERLLARWYPKAAYAPFVQFGTAPHEIRPINKRVLANKKTGEIFGTLVHHPGTKPNPFMERIIGKATPDINKLFIQALDLINKEIVRRVKPI